MISTSSSKGLARSQPGGAGESGFTLIELLLGLTLSVVLALAVAPLWNSLQSRSVSEGDQTLRLLQGRVAVSRFERDLRLASAEGAPFGLSAPIVEATDSRVVFLAPSEGGATPLVMEWELVGSTLMRRWGYCPSTRALALSGSVYRDNKTMVEGVRGESLFRYVVRGQTRPAAVTEAELAAIQEVVLDLRTASEGARSPVRVVSEARVGR